jgi:hypothetical protein
MGRSRQKKSDNMVFGLTWGVIVPLAIFLIIYIFRYREIPLNQFIANLREMKILIKILSLCGFSNLMTFLFFYRKKMDKAAKGVIAATFLYAILVLLSRLF